MVTDWISISEAARRFGVSRKTIRRRVKDSEIETRTGVRNSRQARLVRTEDIERIFHENPIKRQRVNMQWQKQVDEALIVAYSVYQRNTINLSEADQQRDLDLRELRESPLGQELAALAAIANGDFIESRTKVQTRIDNVLQLFFWPPMVDEYIVPRSFWSTDFGLMLSRAKLRCLDNVDLWSLSQAASELGVSRPAVYRFLDERILDFVYDGYTGRVYIVADDARSLITAMQQQKEEKAVA